MTENVALACAATAASTLVVGIELIMVVGHWCCFDVGVLDRARVINIWDCDYSTAIRYRQQSKSRSDFDYQQEEVALR